MRKGVLPLVAAMGAFAGCAADPGALTDAEKLARIEAFCAGIQTAFPSVQSVLVGEFLALRKERDVALVDVRAEPERSVSGIAGAISKEEFEQGLARYRNMEIIICCTIGDRSAAYCEELRGRGIHARNLRGGILAWAHAGEPLVDASGAQVKRAHVHAKKWNLLPAGYEGVW